MGVITPTEQTLDSDSQASEEETKESETWPGGKFRTLGVSCMIDKSGPSVPMGALE